MAKRAAFVTVVLLCAYLVFPELAHASLEGSLTDLKSKLTGVIMPLLSVIGIVVAAASFFTGNQNAKQHIFYAILGCIFGFGAQSIVDFISQTVR